MVLSLNTQLASSLHHFVWRSSQVLLKDPSVITLADNGSLTGKVLRSKLMAEGLEMEVWQRTKKELKAGFGQIVRDRDQDKKKLVFN